MAYKVKQFRYYNDESSNTGRNYPAYLNDNIDTPITQTHYITGDVFGTYFPVVQLGVQALPGTEIYLNEATDPIIIGQTGIYELDLDNGIQVTKITVTPRSMQEINSNNNAYLIVDVIYDDGEG